LFDSNEVETKVQAG